MKRYGFHCLLAVMVCLAISGEARSAATYEIVAADSRIEIAVFRGGLLKAFGHDHLVAARDLSGSVTFHPNRLNEAVVALTVVANSLVVLDTGEPEADRREVQATMLSGRVLDAATFPLITFNSTAVKDVRQSGEGWDILLEGRLALHGIERPIAFPVRVELAGERLVGRGEVALAQTAFGIDPVTAAGGLVRVRDGIRIWFSLVGVKGESGVPASPTGPVPATGNAP